MTRAKGPRVLLLDIETRPIEAHVWGIWDQNIALNQIKTDWSVLSWSAKWLGSSKIMQEDQSKAKVIEDDKALLQGIWRLIDEADIIITQNGKKFDIKKLNARFVKHGMQPPSSFKHIDTLVIAKKSFGFTSNKLEYLADHLGVKYKKLVDRKFPGFVLWKECLAKNPKAWQEMRIYNNRDVLVLEEVYKRLIPWDNSIDFGLYSGVSVCSCGSYDFKENGYRFTAKGKYKRYKCKSCGRETQDNINELSKHKVKKNHKEVL